MSRAWWAVVRKELRDALRDKRAWAVILFTSMLSGPATLLMLSHFISTLESRAQAREVMVAGQAHGPALVNYLERQGRVIVPAPADHEAQMASGALEQAVLRIPDDFTEQLERGEPARVEIVSDTNRSATQASARMIGSLVQEFAREQRLQRLVARGVAPLSMTVVKVEDIDLGSARGRFTQMLFLVPMAALIAAVVGALSVAIDVTAGERERGSLEPLLMNPVPTWILVLGKWTVVCLASVATLVLSISGFALASLLIRNELLAAAMQFGPREVAIFLTMLVPFSGMIAAVLMLAAVFARGHKEAQATTSYLVSLVALVPTITMMISVRDGFWQLLVPALGQNMVLSRAVKGGAITLVDLCVPGLVALGIAIVALAVQSLLLRRESIIFGRQ